MGREIMMVWLFHLLFVFSYLEHASFNSAETGFELCIWYFHSEEMASVSSGVDVKEEPLSPLLEYDQVRLEFFIANGSNVFITNTTAVE